MLMNEAKMSGILTKAEQVRDEFERIQNMVKAALEDSGNGDSETFDRMDSLYSDMDDLCSEIQDFRDADEVPF